MPEYVGLLEGNVARNGLEHRCRVREYFFVFFFDFFLSFFFRRMSCLGVWGQGVRA